MIDKGSAFIVERYNLKKKNVKGWVKGTPFTYKLLIDRIIQGKVKGEENIHYNSSHTRISIPLYTTTILCSCVEPIACFTVSVSA